MDEGAGGGHPVPPASEAAIAALPQVPADADMLGDTGSAECTICMDAVKIGEVVTKLHCKHWFHTHCITPWLNEHNTCPHCRQSVDTEPPGNAGAAPAAAPAAPAAGGAPAPPRTPPPRPRTAVASLADLRRQVNEWQPSQSMMDRRYFPDVEQPGVSRYDRYDREAERRRREPARRDTGGQREFGSPPGRGSQLRDGEQWAPVGSQRSSVRGVPVPAWDSDDDYRERLRRNEPRAVHHAAAAALANDDYLQQLTRGPSSAYGMNAAAEAELAAADDDISVMEAEFAAAEAATDAATSDNTSGGSATRDQRTTNDDRSSLPPANNGSTYERAIRVDSSTPSGSPPSRSPPSSNGYMNPADMQRLHRNHRAQGEEAAPAPRIGGEPRGSLARRSASPESPRRRSRLVDALRSRSDSGLLSAHLATARHGRQHSDDDGRGGDRGGGAHTPRFFHSESSPPPRRDEERGYARRSGSSGRRVGSHSERQRERERARERERECERDRAGERDRDRERDREREVARRERQRGGGVDGGGSGLIERARSWWHRGSQ
jgi:hypothetical protein